MTPNLHERATPMPHRLPLFHPAFFVGLGAMTGFVTAVPLVKVLLWLAIADFVSGTLAAIQQDGDGLLGTTLKARVMLRGLFKKGTMFMLCGGLFLVRQAVSFEIPMPEGFAINVHPANALAAAMCVMEFVSLAENYVLMGGKVPLFVLTLLEKWKR